MIIIVIIIIIAIITTTNIIIIIIVGISTDDVTHPGLWVGVIQFLVAIPQLAIYYVELIT